MSKYIMISAVYIIAAGFAGCLVSQIFGIGSPSAATGIGAGVGLIGAVLYYLFTKDAEQV